MSAENVFVFPIWLKEYIFYIVKKVHDIQVSAPPQKSYVPILHILPSMKNLSSEFLPSSKCT